MIMVKRFSYKAIYNTRSLQIFQEFLSILISYDGLRIEITLKNFISGRKFSQNGKKRDLGSISDDPARVAHSSSSSLASHMKKNVCAGEVIKMKFQCHRAKSKAIMKDTYGLSCSSHPTPKNWWEFSEKG